MGLHLKLNLKQGSEKNQFHLMKNIFTLTLSVSLWTTLPCEFDYFTKHQEHCFFIATVNLSQYIIVYGIPFCSVFVSTLKQTQNTSSFVVLTFYRPCVTHVIGYVGFTDIKPSPGPSL